MGIAQKFEELECWQCARELVGMVYTSSIFLKAQLLKYKV